MRPDLLAIEAFSAWDVLPGLVMAGVFVLLGLKVGRLCVRLMLDQDEGPRSYRAPSFELAPEPVLPGDDLPLECVGCGAPLELLRTRCVWCSRAYGMESRS